MDTLDVTDSGINTLGKIVIGSALAYAAYVAFTCPCKILLSCHLTQMYTAILIAVLGMLFFNGFRLFSY